MEIYIQKHIVVDVSELKLLMRSELYFLVIATISSLIGILSSSLLVAVLAQKLLLSREEKYLHTFVLNTELSKKHHYYAANVVKFSIKV